MPLCCYAGIYRYQDERGVYHFTNITPIGRKYVVIIPDKPGPIETQAIEATNYDILIIKHSKDHGIDPSLVKAVMKVESNFNPYAVSPKGAQGLMQLMPETARLMKVRNPFDPDENIKGGIRYLKFLEEAFQGDLELMLAAYNAGPSKVIENNMKVPPINETRTFVKRVKDLYKRLKSSKDD
jgi:soluble lytic murein transglycosylase